MIFGHNTNLRIDNVTLHVQTEDRGESHALIDTTVYYRGQVIHRRTNAYFDLLPLDDDRLEALRLRLEDQHHTVIEDIRSGALQVIIPHESVPSSAAQPHAAPPGASQTLSLELTNANSWLAGRHAHLQITVREPHGGPVAGAQVRVEIEGSENNQCYRAQTGPRGEAEIEFDMPRITGPQAALVIYADNHSAKGHLRFALRAKPRVA